MHRATYLVKSNRRILHAPSAGTNSGENDYLSLFTLGSSHIIQMKQRLEHHSMEQQMIIEHFSLPNSTFLALSTTKTEDIGLRV